MILLLIVWMDLPRHWCDATETVGVTITSSHYRNATVSTGGTLLHHCISAAKSGNLKIQTNPFGIPGRRYL
jgi:hypothetical protein